MIIVKKKKIRCNVKSYYVIIIWIIISSEAKDPTIIGLSIN